MAVLQLPDPYDFVRFITGALAAVWTVRGAVGMWRFLRRMEESLGPDRAERAWLRRVVLLVVARTTVLDPVNLALMLVLVALWTIHL